MQYGWCAPAHWPEDVQGELSARHSATYVIKSHAFLLHSACINLAIKMHHRDAAGLLRSNPLGGLNVGLCHSSAAPAHTLAVQ